jgi:hypothetical protein
MNGFRFIPASVAMLGATAALLAGAAHDHDSEMAAVAVAAGVAALALLIADGLVARTRGRHRGGEGRSASRAELDGASSPTGEPENPATFGVEPNGPSGAGDEARAGPT